MFEKPIFVQVRESILHLITLLINCTKSVKTLNDICPDLGTMLYIVYIVRVLGEDGPSVRAIGIVKSEIHPSPRSTRLSSGRMWSHSST